MSIALHVLAHRDPAQIERLLRVIVAPPRLTIVHIDRRAPPELHAVPARFRELGLPVIVQRPRPVVWCGWQGLHTQLEAIRIALSASRDWTHFVTLSGADFPLRPLAEISAALSAVPTTSYIEHRDILATGLWTDAKRRVEAYHVASPVLIRLLRTPFLGRRLRAVLGGVNNPVPSIPGIRRRFPSEWPYLGGLNWCILARPACEWLVTSKSAIQFARWIKHALVPDEIYFQSTLCSRHSPIKVVNHSGHFVEFPPNGIHPRILTRADLPAMERSGRFFGRKFDLSVDAGVLDELERRITHDASRPSST